jgi:hypothetical protein
VRAHAALRTCPLIDRRLENDAMARKTKDPMDDKYVQKFKEHLEQVDAFTLIVLKSHLIMESAIDNIIRLIFFWPDIILDARMNFFQKVEIVRAYSLREDEMSIWKLMHAIAELRNEVAHNLDCAYLELHRLRMASRRTLGAACAWIGQVSGTSNRGDGMDIGKLNRMVAEDAALRRRQVLQPAGGQGDKIFPPTYPGEGRNAPPRHVYERRRLARQKQSQSTASRRASSTRRHTKLRERLASPCPPNRSS